MATLVGRLALVLPQVAAAVTLLYILNVVVYAFTFSPVRHIPGPWWVRISRLPLLLAIYQRKRSKYASDLLAKYGSIVVIAPDQVHTNDTAAMKVIYSRKSLKTPFYAGMGSWKGVTTTLGFVDYAGAAPTRNNLIQWFQNKNLTTLVANISSHIAEFCEMLRREAAAGQDVDGVVQFRLLALDIVTDVLWGETRTLLAHSSSDTPDFLRRFHAFSTYNAMKSFIPGFDTYTRLLGSRKWRTLRRDCSDMDVTAKEALARWTSEAEHRDRDVLSMLLSMDDALDASKRVPKDHVPAYMVEMLVAGSSTTSHTATFTLFQLAHHPEVQEKLREELVKQYPDAHDIAERKLMDLPFLDAVIKETMRLTPMIPGPLERILADDIMVDGLRVPPRVIASTAAYDQGRLSSVFPEPDRWHPERWLSATEEMHINWTPFGYGSRSCPGANLAMVELKYMIGIICRRFEVRPPTQHAPVPLDLADVLVSGQRSGQCWLNFTEL